MSSHVINFFLGFYGDCPDIIWDLLLITKKSNYQVANQVAKRILKYHIFELQAEIKILLWRELYSIEKFVNIDDSANNYRDNLLKM